MNEKPQIHIWYIFLASIAAFVFAGCGEVVPTIIPTPQPPTAIPPYIHYTPSEGSNVHLEFDYPSSWTFEEPQDTKFVVIGLGDPRFRNLPTQSPEDFHPIPNDFGSIDIWTLPYEPGQTAGTELEVRKQGYKDEPHIKLLQDYHIMIDGYDAGVLEYKLEDWENYTSLMFSRRIIFVVEDQLYEILFEVAEKDRGGEFEQGYEYFFNSLKIVP